MFVLKYTECTRYNVLNTRIHATNHTNNVLIVGKPVAKYSAKILIS